MFQTGFLQAGYTLLWLRRSGIPSDPGKIICSSGFMVQGLINKRTIDISPNIKTNIQKREKETKKVGRLEI